MLLRTLSAWMTCWTLLAVAPLAAADTGRAAQAMTTAARALLDATPAPQQAQLLQPLTLEARGDWNYTPRSRPGIAFKSMDKAQRDAAQALLAAALSAPGLVKVQSIIALEIALREIESFGFSRDPENYAFAFFGAPDAKAPWGWRIEGHHLSLHFTLADGQVVATLPQFLGANPAQVPRDIAAQGGPRKGERALGEEEDRAFALLNALTAAQRRQAVFSDRPFGDIVTRNAALLEPLAPVGIAFSGMDAAQQALLLRIVESLASVAESSLAQQRLERVRAGGLDGIRFGWAGATERGQPHYWRIQGARFLIEWDNSGGNHIHNVWRDFEGDWGRDALGDHYRRARGSAHRH
ncbi:DUF3500 domain-containing protein [Variovorax sp. KK3]|uniref:DUF3500 domain-containing protein n=1 Tax=Variovorax sp. KK3 TaxID=1855728 RepID=UPI0009F92817|nr:DUF3500 domain-containing protein [Variovorax sp. KK3]